VVPLIILSAVFPSLTPVAVTAMLIPLLVCAAAAAQADIPARRKTVWSRPLVALLFFLQPIVRGWARYQGRLSVQRRALAEYESLDSLSRQASDQQFDQLHYWDDKGVDRISFLQAIMERLDQRDWPNKVDLGWNNFDLEIYGSRWCHLQLITVTEVFGANKQMIRCRLRTVWTLFARTVFWGLTGLELMVIGFAGPKFPWLWAVLITLPLLAWWLNWQKRSLRRIIAVFLNQTAAELGLEKVRPAAPPTAPNPAPSRVSGRMLASPPL
jgi:hypothetical protein